MVVLSGGHHLAPGTAKFSEWHDPDRILAGLDLYRQGNEPRLLFSSVSVHFDLASHRRTYLFGPGQQVGIPASELERTPLVVNTAQEAMANRNLLQGFHRSTPQFTHLYGHRLFP